MKVADYLVDFLIKKGTTDAFGLPGAVILEVIYAMDRRRGEFCPHLSYHEQAAGFAAAGYAQASGKLGVAYATRGPGFTNLITPIADAYCDSIPVLFLTSHAAAPKNKGMRIEANQEVDTCDMVKNITKYNKRVTTVEEFISSLSEAYRCAMTGRRGPVFLDINSQLWKEDVVITDITIDEKNSASDCLAISEEIIEHINGAKRPILLIGDGINQSRTSLLLEKFANKIRIPVLSSRYAHDIMGESPFYYGYVGSFGLRYANFILSKADLIVSLGNRLNFPINSSSYKNIPYQAKIIRLEVDQYEFLRDIPNAVNYRIDLEDILSVLASNDGHCTNHEDWVTVCDEIRGKLWDSDANEVVIALDTILSNVKTSCGSITNDVGDNEFWVSRACAHSKCRIKSLYSKSFASLGSALPKAIGAYFSTKRPVLCFTGDQGFQMNMQELQAIAQERLPILIVVMNNSASGMIRDKEKKSYGAYLHSTLESGYGIPDISRIAAAYDISYYNMTTSSTGSIGKIVSAMSQPIILNLRIDPELGLSPYLPIGRQTQDMEPKLEESLYNDINKL